MDSFIYLFNKYLLSVSYLPSTVRAVRNTAMSKTVENSSLMELLF